MLYFHKIYFSLLICKFINSFFILNNLLFYIEIANILEITDAAVDALLQRAKANLKKILKEYYKSFNAGE